MKKKKTKKTPTVWTGPTSLAGALRPIAELVADPRNARRHDERNLAAIRASVTAFGQLRPLVVQQSTGHVVAGNGTLEVLRGLGWTHAAVTVVDLDDARARAFAIADNRTAELASWDVAELQAALSDPELDGLLDAVGFSADEIDEMIRETDRRAETERIVGAGSLPAHLERAESRDQQRDDEPETEREREKRLEGEADDLLAHDLAHEREVALQAARLDAEQQRKRAEAGVEALRRIQELAKTVGRLRLQAEIHNELLRLTGPDPDDVYPPSSTSRPRYAGD
ncbi:MAG: ParB N-terminal domain-containing protein [Phycisphaerales bacterium]|nr:ParB N-terminal domain-containing protein [Phycisphaerales bacterium]